MKKWIIYKYADNAANLNFLNYYIDVRNLFKFLDSQKCFAWSNPSSNKEFYNFTAIYSKVSLLEILEAID